MVTATRIGAGERALSNLLARVAERHPDLAGRAEDELAVTLQATRRSSVGDLAWEASCLTATRAPIEVAITSARRELRTTVDVIAPEEDRRRALEECVRLATGFGGMAPDAGTLSRLRNHQSDASLRWGAWLGSRHRSDGSSHKLYVELSRDPNAARAVVDTLAAPARRILPPGARLRFLGLPLDGSGAVEVYARPHAVDAADAAAVVGRAGFLPGDASALIAASGLVDHGDRRPTRNVGVSVALDGSANVTAIALFGFAHDRFRRDHRVRRRILAEAHDAGWPSTALYADATRPLAAPRPLARPCHTVVSDVVTRSGEILRHIGLAPPPGGRLPASDPLTPIDEGELK